MTSYQCSIVCGKFNTPIKVTLSKFSHGAYCGKIQRRGYQVMKRFDSI